VVDQSTGLTREMSLHDLEQRAIACSTRLTEEQSPATATERMELRRKQYADELNSHEQTLKALASAHNNAMRCFQNDLNQAAAAHRKIAPQAQEVEMAYRAEGREKSLPIIPHERLNELHEQAVERRDVKQIERLNEIRQALPAEFGGSMRDEYAVARLQAQRFTADTDCEVSKKRLEDFEQSHYLRRWEVNGEKWSRAEIDRHIARQEKAAAYYEARAGGDIRQSLRVMQGQNPARIFKLSEHRAKSEEATIQAAQARAEIDRVQPIREEIVKLTEARRAELTDELENNTRFANVLLQIEGGERELQTTLGREMPAPVYTEAELRRVEANAATLCNPELLKQHQALVRSAGNTPDAIEKLAACAFAREQVAKIALRESTERLTNFEERRADMPLLYKSAFGEEEVTTMRKAKQEAESSSWSERLGGLFTDTSNSHVEHEAVQQVARERHAELLKNLDLVH